MWMKTVEKTYFTLDGWSIMYCCKVEKWRLCKASQQCVQNWTLRCQRCRVGAGRSIMGSKVRAEGRTKRQEDALLFFLLSGQERLRKNLLVMGQVTLQPFFSITCCPVHPFFASAVAPAWAFGALCWQKRGRDGLLTWQSALIRFSLGLL